jgi:hypothetical protein
VMKTMPQKMAINAVSECIVSALPSVVVLVLTDGDDPVFDRAE